MGLLTASLVSQPAYATSFFVDCSLPAGGDGSQAHPWNEIAMVTAHDFQPGDTIALRRGTHCEGSLALHGSGNAEARIRLTAWGEGPRPRIVASGADIQAVLLKNAEYWQIDSLDIAGGNTYGVLVAADQDRVFNHISLRNLVVHDVRGGEMHDKDNGLVVFLRGSQHARFDHVLIENVVAAHTNQWSGIMMGAGQFYTYDADYNHDVTIRNSVAHDVYGDGIILFRVNDGSIDSSTAWLTGQQPTQNVGTPNAIWTWSCTDCTVRNSESFLTESPGVDGGAYDIDWATTRNTVENNYAHDTQGYCVAVFAAGYVTHDAIVRNNVCINNGLSPRMSRTEGAVYIHAWDNGRIDGMIVEKNLIDWNPPAPAASIVNDEGTEFEGQPIVFRDNVVRSTSPQLTRSFGNRLFFQNNQYDYSGLASPSWFWNGRTWTSLEALQAAGAEKGSTIRTRAESQEPDRDRRSSDAPAIGGTALTHLVGLDGRQLASLPPAQYRLITRVDLRLDADELIAPDAMAQLSVLRTLVREYNEKQLQVLVFVSVSGTNAEMRNALLDLDAPSIHFVQAKPKSDGPSTVLTDSQGRIAAQWSETAGSLSAAVLGYVVRQRLGMPIYAQMDSRP